LATSIILSHDRNIKLYIDHQALISISNKGGSSGQRIAEFDFDIIHILGKEMAVTDHLSRISGPGVADPTPDEKK